MIPALHIVTDDEILRRPEFLSRAVGVLEAGGNEAALHLRGPMTTGKVMYSLAEKLLEAAAGIGGVLVVNDRVDIALALESTRVHLGQRSLPPKVARWLLGPRCLLGLSVHGAEEVGDDAAGVLDYLMAGTVFASPSHPHSPPGGVARIREVREASGLPVLAIGGISRERVREVCEAGAHGIAVRGGIWDATDPGRAVSGYLTELKRA